MGRSRGKPNLSTEQKALIAGMVDAGMSHGRVAKAVGLGQTTVSAIVSRSRTRGTVETAKKSGRPRLNDDRDLRQLRHFVENHQKLTLAEVTDSMTTHVSSSTIRRRIHEMGYNNRIAVKKPFINAKNREKRLAFANEHLEWTIADWSKVIWSDESSFETGKLSQQVHVWRQAKEEMKPECLEPTFKSGRSSTSIWGAFFGITKIPIVFLRSSGTKAVDYIDQVYKGRLVDTLATVDPNHQILLMEDNASSHTAKLSQEFRAKHHITRIVWPPQSPDLNPTENLWKFLKTGIYNQYHPKSLEQMREAIQQAWDDIPAENLRNLVKSMPNRMRLVVEASGGPIRY
ncbi:hypothetical protein MJO28_010086 [Puccinia striiformis f. sp. tritici]|uniref:Uncharacterized protein n=1 Tax=Puccinia striiformis f. sp. tritici TaxID=168172 RepID=A0ACC0E4W4_9BASI|nr:hypothetical protein MJO28_010086 [Puccinia striiformis f. sp. tritici]